MDIKKLEKLINEHEEWQKSINNGRIDDSYKGPRKLSLSGEKARKIELKNRQLSEATIINCDFLHSIFDETDFSNSDLTGSRFREASFVRAKFVNANLSSTILIKANLNNARLTKAKLTGTDLNGANLENSTVAGADLRRSSAKYVNFTNARLNGANFENSDLSNACFKQVNALKVNFRNCILNEADFTGANLNDVGFLGATMRLTRFESKSQLKQLRNKLTQEQLQSVIFSDEINYEPKDDECGILQVILDANNITPINLSYVFVSLNASYNNLLYLTSTKDSVDEISHNLLPYYSANNAKDDLYVRQITKGSIIIDFVAYVGGGAVILKLLGDLIPKISAEIRGFKALPSEKKLELEERSLELDIQLKELEVREKQLILEEKQNQLLLSNENVQEAIHLEYISNKIEISDIVSQLEFATDEVRDDAENYIKKGIYPLLNVLYKYEEMGYGVKAEYVGNSLNNTP